MSQSKGLVVALAVALMVAMGATGISLQSRHLLLKTRSRYLESTNIKTEGNTATVVNSASSTKPPPASPQAKSGSQAPTRKKSGPPPSVSPTTPSVPAEKPPQKATYSKNDAGANQAQILMCPEFFYSSVLKSEDNSWEDDGYIKTFSNWLHCYTLYPESSKAINFDKNVFQALEQIAQFSNATENWPTANTIAYRLLVTEIGFKSEDVSRIINTGYSYKIIDYFKALIPAKDDNDAKRIVTIATFLFITSYVQTFLKLHQAPEDDYFPPVYTNTPFGPYNQDTGPPR